MTIALRLTEAEEARTSAQRLADAAADQVNAIDALSAFLSREIAELAGRGVTVEDYGAEPEAEAVTE